MKLLSIQATLYAKVDLKWQDCQHQGVVEDAGNKHRNNRWKIIKGRENEYMFSKVNESAISITKM